MCVGITIIKRDSTCHSQTHGTEPPMHFCCSHYISPCFLSTSPFHSLSLSCFLFLSLSFSLSLFISAPSFSLWLQDTCHLMPFTKYSLLDQSYFFTPYLSIAHIKFTNYSPTIFYDYHPQSCLKTSFSLSGQPSSSCWWNSIQFQWFFHSSSCPRKRKTSVLSAGAIKRSRVAESQTWSLGLGRITLGKTLGGAKGYSRRIKNQ